MKLQFRKEVKHSVVYEVPADSTATPEQIPARSVYVSKAFLETLTGPKGVHGWPETIELEVKGG